MASKPARPKADLELLQAVRAWAGGRRGESASDDALNKAAEGGRFRLRGAFDRFFRNYARLNWLLEQHDLAQTPDNLWAAGQVILEKATLEDVAAAIAVTTADTRRLAGAFGRLSASALDDPSVPPEARLECPAWAYPILSNAFGPALEAELRALNMSAVPDLRLNTLKAEERVFLETMAAADITLTRLAYSPLAFRTKGRPDLAATEAFTKGLFEFQDEGSQLVAALCDAQPGLQVLDFCAGAGGKSLALAAAMANRGHLVAADVNERRLARTKLRFKRAGIENAERVLLTGADDDPFLRRRKVWFDRILVDAPCSGTGAWRRHPESKWRPDAGLDRIEALQDSILDRVAPLAKLGGRLIYATCSLLPVENEERVEAFLIRHDNYRRLNAADIWAGVLQTPWPCGASPYLKLTPAQHGTDGFFAAILERTA